MEKIIMLGTGKGLVLNLYETCFILDNNGKTLLVDTGGGRDIVKNLQKKGYNLNDIHDIFISHIHTDHILGLLWILKRQSVKYLSNKIKDKINIYCNSEVTESIKKLISSVYPNEMFEAIKNMINIHTLYDGETLNIADEEITFFDTKTNSNLLYGFETKLKCGKRLVFLGDETCNPIMYDKLKGADYVMHEAFCLDSDTSVSSYAKEHHSTVKKVCQNLSNLNIKNLIIFHTEDRNAKELYIEEAEKYFDGNVIVPKDLDEIEIN